MTASFEHFVELARTAVEAEAGLHADDRWWVLEPTLLVQRARGGIEHVDLSEVLAHRPAGRALLAGDLAGLADALDVRRCAVAVHVDLELDGEIAPAIVLVAGGALVTACQFARVERTDAGTPRLGPWEPSLDLEPQIGPALRRKMTEGARAP